jgi:hypothetical protein
MEEHFVKPAFKSVEEIATAIDQLLAQANKNLEGKSLVKITLIRRELWLKVVRSEVKKDC